MTHSAKSFFRFSTVFFLVFGIVFLQLPNSWILFRTAKASSNTALALSGTYIGDGSSGTRVIAGLGFQPDIVVIKSSDALMPTVIRTSTMLGAIDISTNNGFMPDTLVSLDDDGFTVGAGENQRGINYYWTAYRAAPGELVVGKYTGNGVPGHAITGIGFTPRVVFVMSHAAVQATYSPKIRSTTMTWGHSFFSETLNNTRITGLIADGFTLGGAAATNFNGAEYDYIAWNHVPGRMNVGSYIGNGNDDVSITGVGFQPETVWIFPESDIYPPVWRTASLLGDNTLQFNSNRAVLNQIQAFNADGFQVGNSSEVNQNGIKYHWIAWGKVEAPIISTDSLENDGGAVGMFYTQNLSASQGSGSYSNWNVDTGNLPDEVFLDSASGVISGTPTTAGTFSFGITVADSNGVGSRLVNGQIRIVDQVSIMTDQLISGEESVSYLASLAAVGGSTPYSNWTVSSGNLPNGLTLDPATGVIFGIPTQAETAHFSVTVMDSNSVVSSPVALSIIINPPPIITTATLPDGVVGASYIKSLTVEGGSGTLGVASIVSGVLPSGLNLDSDTGVIFGTPTAVGVFTFGVTATDSNGVVSPEKQFTVTVRPAQTYAVTGVYVGDCDQNNVAACNPSRAITGLGFQPDVVILKSAETVTRGVMRTSTMVGDNSTSLCDQFHLGFFPNMIKSLDVDGFSIGTSAPVNELNVHYYWTAFKAVPGELELGTYDGTGVPRSVAGLQFSPDLVFVAPETAAPGSWAMPVFRSALESWSHIFFSELGQPSNRIIALNEDGFSVGTENTVNLTGTKYHYVAFKKVNGVFNTDQYLGDDVGGRDITGVGFPPEDAWIQGEGDLRVVRHPAPLLGDNTLVFAPFPQDIDYIISLLNDGFKVGAHGRVNKKNFVYTWFAWAKRLVVATDSLPAGAVQMAYSQNLVATGGSGIYDSWNIIFGALPPGLDLNSETGVIYGTPTVPGTFHFAVTVTDSNGITSSDAVDITMIINLQESSTALVTSKNPSLLNEPVTFTATVSGAAGIPTGIVTFKDGVDTLSMVALDATGHAQYQISNLTVATHPITAVYDGDGVYSSSVSPVLDQVVTKPTPTVTPISHPNPSQVNQTVTFYAIVSGAYGIPSGTVNFYDGATYLGMRTLSSKGQAAFWTSTLSPGSHSITITYSGNAVYNSATSSPLIQIVQ